MNTGAKKAVFLVMTVLLALTAVAAKDKPEKADVKNLPERFKKWLIEEVVYIISPIEHDVFLQLKSDLERDLFIKAFWKQRDPNPNTPDNEFQNEHYNRIRYANTWFGKDSPAPGWRTDQGRIYIQLGPPKSVEKIENNSQLYPLTIWYYQGMSEFGLPNSFNVVFFKRDGQGEYELYSPLRFGPQYLMNDYTGDMTDYESAYFALQQIEPAIAETSLTLIPGDANGFRPSMASEFLIKEKIPEAPIKKINTIYAEKMLRFKDMVEVDYSVNYIDSAKTVSVIRDPASGIAFVHYLIEPRKLSIEQYDQSYYATLEIFGNVTDDKNNTVFQINKTVPLQLSAEQIAKVKDKLFSYQDMFPLIPGKYKMTILLKNTVSKEFTSIEKDIEIPANPVPGISPLLLANRLIENSSYSGQSKPFLIGSHQLVPSPRNDFLASDTLAVYFQVNALDESLKAGGQVQFDILKGTQNVLSFSRKISEYPMAPDIIEKIPLSGFKPENYLIRVSLLSPDRRVLATQESYYYITPMPVLPRPWVVSVPQSSKAAPQYWNDLGNQYLNLNQPDQARSLLERAFHLAPQNPRFAADYCRILMLRQEFQLAMDIALPMFKSERFEFALTLAQASQSLNRHNDAVDYFQQYIAHFGSNPRILNALGESLLAVGNSSEAQKVWEKSLEIDPKQDKIRERVAALKGTKK